MSAFAHGQLVNTHTHKKGKSRILTQREHFLFRTHVLKGTCTTSLATSLAKSMKSVNVSADETNSTNSNSKKKKKKTHVNTFCCMHLSFSNFDHPSFFFFSISSVTLVVKEQKTQGLVPSKKEDTIMKERTET